MIALTAEFGIYPDWRQHTGNFAAVVAGEVYRSNQPTPERLSSYQRELGIRSVLNLRGANPGAGWYEAEKREAHDLGLTLIDFWMSANPELSPDQTETLITILRDAPKPLLIHCRSGADQTGLASVIYEAIIDGIDEQVAERQFSIRFGHFSVPVLSSTWPMDATWERIEQSSDFKQAPHRSAHG